MSLIGKNVTNYKLQAYQNGDFIELTEEDAKGKWGVYFFYPADFTFVCPTELEDVANYYEDFKKINTEVYSVSTDSHFAHKQWHEQSEAVGKIKFPMIADPAAILAKGFDILVEKDWQALRGTFIVNPEGVIVAYEVHDMGIGRNAEELLRKVQAAQFVAENGDQVCPANWKPGEETLKPSFDLVGKI